MRTLNQPDFLIIGAAKAGTTALYNYLGQHPQVYMGPSKEPNFFTFYNRTIDYGGPSTEIIRKWSTVELSDYLTLFSAASKGQVCGEASTTYLYYPHVPAQIKKFKPDMKIIAILRNPIDRAFSNYLYMRRDERETIKNFYEALQAEQKRIKENWEFIWHYIQLGFYFQQLTRYFDIFDRSQIRIYLHDDLHRNTNATIKNIYNFLDVSHDFTPDTTIKPNISGIPKNRLLYNLVNNAVLISIGKLIIPIGTGKQAKQKINKMLLSRPVMDAKTRDFLQDIYREDILSLQILIQRNLSDWLKT